MAHRTGRGCSLVQYYPAILEQCIRTYKRHRNLNPGQLHCTTAACTIPLSHHFYTISFLNQNGIKITYKMQCLTKYFNIVLKYFVYTDSVRFYHNSYLWRFLNSATTCQWKKTTFVKEQVSRDFTIIIIYRGSWTLSWPVSEQNLHLLKSQSH